MNLHGIVRGAVTAVNPDIPVTWRKSTGYTTDNTGRRTPTYSDSVVDGQAQALSGKDLKQLEAQGIAMQGVMAAVYLYGDVQGIKRVDGTGGDLLLFAWPSGASRTWLVTQVLESWPDWCKVAVTLQVN